MNTMKILLVEDVAMIMKISKRLVENLGYQADCAMSGEEAIELFKKKDYDLVITDIGLPKMDGIQLIAKMRKHERRFRYKESRIFAVTAYDMKDVRSPCLSSGVNGVFKKPLQLPLLMQIIQDCELHLLENHCKEELED
jgi:two-component system, OmpR family, aerobic respiration control sensor histidine kinase ArcB